MCCKDDSICRNCGKRIKDFYGTWMHYDKSGDIFVVCDSVKRRKLDYSWQDGVYNVEDGLYAIPVPDGSVYIEEDME